MRTLLPALLLILSAAGCATSMPLPEAAGTASGIVFDRAIAAWANVLDRYVDDQGRVDFVRLGKDRDDLDLFVVYVGLPKSSGFRQEFPKPADRLAYFLNAYNALAAYNVLESGAPPEISGLRALRMMALHDFMFGGSYRSLWEFKNRVIRSIGDERVHFALSDMIRGSPPLPREPFTGPRLDQELDARARVVINDPRFVRVDASRGTVALSELFRDYRKDFLAHAPSLIAYVNKYRAQKIPESYRVEFLPTDRTLNAQPPTPAP